jgi:nucleoside-diphosphate-sugar epimerase
MEHLVLITGITGFVGGALAARVVAKGDPVVVVVRAKSVPDARRRVVQSLARFVGPAAEELTAASVRVIVGDLAADDTYETSELDRVTHVVHAAACTSFASTREVWRTNVEGTRKLASRMFEVRGLRRFLYVSTAYGCGDRPSRIVREDDSPRAEHTHVNEYACSKTHAELSLSAMRWDDRLVIARPSVIVGHTRLGTGPSSSLFWYYRALAALRCGPFELDDRRDVVPVDYVADALAFLVALDRPRFRTYHVSAGENASPLGEILRGLAQDGSSTWRKVSAAALANMADELRPFVQSDDEARKVARGLGACAKFGELGVQCFDNSRLLSEGFRQPPSFLDYLHVCARSSAGASIFEQMIDHA